MRWRTNGTFCFADSPLSLCEKFGYFKIFEQFILFLIIALMWCIEVFVDLSQFPSLPWNRSCSMQSKICVQAARGIFMSTWKHNFWDAIRCHLTMTKTQFSRPPVPHTMWFWFEELALWFLQWSMLIPTPQMIPAPLTTVEQTIASE